MANDFNLGQFRFKRTDGTGDVLTCPTCPSAVIQTTTLKETSPEARKLPGFFIAYFCAKSAGLLSSLGVAEDEDPVSGALDLFSRYAMDSVDLDDDGNEQGDGIEDPTNPTSGN